MRWLIALIGPAAPHLMICGRCVGCRAPAPLPRACGGLIELADHARRCRTRVDADLRFHRTAGDPPRCVIEHTTSAALGRGARRALPARCPRRLP